ncbi:DUF1801 domain-containing protein [Chryseobacterium daecheongense]|uniref:DUF1801 domain-containing protein n=1 Tax=Chryseobacterium daecheongense TaxID=192389 RepID=UPI001FD6503D|nr:DUF1801 domain-containing protein [Chryseobacterium daecheongense]UOV00121.1 DUF1801 domain-containing protein [Chryseobacterium daecheongense]
MLPDTTVLPGHLCLLWDWLRRKNFIALYHMGIYSKPELLEWFVSEFPKYSKRKLDMGKSCVRFKKIDEIPLELIAELSKKMTVDEWIECYEKNLKR